MNIKLSNSDETVLVSNEMYNELIKYKWYKDQTGYAASKIDNKTWRMHRYIYKEILKKQLQVNIYIDHINHNKLDNTLENLRMVTPQENVRNRKKSQNATSKYFGVCKDYRNLWVSQITLNNSQKLIAYYKIEEHAAYQFNLWINEHNIACAQRNNIEKPYDFILYQKKQKMYNLPPCITYKNNKYCVTYKQKHIGYYKSLDDAITSLEKVKISNNIKLQMIMFKENDIPILILYDKNFNQNAVTYIDENDYEKISKYSWWLSNNYIHGSVNNKKVRLSRFILNYTGNDVVDHINGNTLDNRKQNLRIITRKQNSMNKKSRVNSTSKYLGISYYKRINKWVSEIRIDGKKICIGQFINEIDAAKARDKVAFEHFGEYARLNFPETI